ncbi:MAG: transglutaminase-like domain-containing protein [Gemmatimonadales bacterium]
MRTRRPSLRALAGVAVLTAWAGTLTWLGIRTTGQTEATTLSNEASLRLSPTAGWFAVYSGDEQIGSAGVTLDTLSPGYRIRETVTLELSGEGAFHRATRLTETRLGATLALQDVRSRYSFGARQVEWTIKPGADSATVGYGAGATAVSARFKPPTPAVTLGAMPYRLALTGGLSQGRSRQMLLYGGWPPAARSGLIKVGRDSVVVFADSSQTDSATSRFVEAHRDSVRATEVLIDSPLGPYRLWVDARGGVAGLDWPLGVHWVRSDFDLAVQQFRRDARNRPEAIASALGKLAPLASPGHAADTASGVRQFRVERRDGRAVSGVMLVYFNGGRQRMQGGVLHISSIASPGPRSAGNDRSYDPLAEEGAPEIQALAKQILGGDTGGEALLRLVSAIPKLATVDTAVSAADDALGTLTAHRGRPDGLARLYVAIARAGRVQARYVVGVAPRGDTLFTHAWAEVWDAANNSWFAVDPVFGRPVAGAGLIRIGYAGSSHPDDLRPILAQAKFTPLDSTEAP